MERPRQSQLSEVGGVRSIPGVRGNSLTGSSDLNFEASQIRLFTEMTRTNCPDRLRPVVDVSSRRVIPLLILGPDIILHQDSNPPKAKHL
jgi:hypothetical protein